jgi:hypothetical protein
VRIGEREGLIARVRQMRRADAADDSRAAAEPSRPDGPALAALETRIAHLEELLEGLQDSVHRESQRQSKRLSDLETRVEPATLAVDLERHAREHGLG